MSVRQVTFTRRDSTVNPPRRAHASDAAFDLESAEDFSLEPGERRMVPTGIAVAIPDDLAGLVVPRSGLAARHGISVVNGPGLIDPGYRGEVKVVLVNLGSEPVGFARGDRVAQLLIVPRPTVDLVEVDVLPEADRGEKGFGSTGR